MRVFLDQLGCRLNYSENDTLAGRLNDAGHRIVGRPEDAHVIVLNTCAVTAQAARKSRRAARQLHGRSPHARIALTGCYATMSPQESADLPGVALVVDNQGKDLLHSLLEPWSADFADPDDLARIQPDGTPFGQRRAQEEGGRTRAFVKVQDGCENRCTFCIVTVLRGRSRSLSTCEIVRRIQDLAANGYREAVLTGVHLGAYGRDLPHAQRTDLKELTQAILSDTDIPRLRLSSLEPWETADGLFDLWQRWPGRLCPHLHLPLQAGTDKQLRRMARRCTVESFRVLAAEARAAIPDLVLTTDVIVGFPGETEDDFEESLRFVEEMRFAHAHVFPFSARAGTAAASFGQHVSKACKSERSRRMHQVVARTGRTERRRFLGTSRPVLWEGEGQQLADQPGRLLWTGFTDNYLRVRVRAPARLALSNRITSVQLAELNGDTLYAEL